MGLFDHFPYPDFHQLNLDWILETVSNCVTKVAELWTYVKEPGDGIHKALTDAQAAATSALTSASNAGTAATRAAADAQRADEATRDCQDSAQIASNAVATCTNKAEQATGAASEALDNAEAAQEDAANASVSAETARQQATVCTSEADKARGYALECETALANITAKFAQMYPVGAVYVNFRNQAMPTESDTTVINRLQELTGGTWARAGSHGQPVTESRHLGWLTGILGNAGGDSIDTNFNIYVRTA